MSTTFTARPNQEPEIFPINGWHSHPVYQGFYILRNGDLWLDVGSQMGHLGQFDIRRLPTDRWVTLQDGQGSPLPVEVYVQQFGDVVGRWLSPNSTQPRESAPRPTESAPTPSNPATEDTGLDIDALFGLAAKQTTSVPPALQSTVDDFIDFTGCVLGIVLSERQIDALRAALVQSLSEAGSADAQIIQSQVTAFQGLKSADAKTRHAWRQQNQAPFVAWLSQHEAESPISQLLAQWYAEAQQVITAGQPPLTREAAESWAELSAFAVLIAQGKEPGAETPGNLEAMIAQLARDYAALPPVQQLWMAFAPITLYELRRSWPTLSPPRREGVRMQLAKQFGIALGQTAQTSAGYQPPSPVAPPPATSGAPASSWEQFRQDDTSVAGLQQQWSEAKAKGDESKAAQLQLEVQKALQREAAATAMLSNIASMRHSMMMAVANNLKS
jgi:hypothetical protein